MNNDFVKIKEEYIIGKDIDGKIVTTGELQKVLLKIVLEIDRVFRKNNIGYALAFGSCLGLYNYGGFIPWDDDMDIAFDYFDLPRIIEALKNDLSDEFVFESYESNKRYNVLIPTIKVRLKESYIKEQNHFWLPSRCKSGNGFFVDLVAFMGSPKDVKSRHKVLLKSKRWMPIYVILNALFHIEPYFIKKKLKKYESEMANLYKDSDYVSQTVIIPFQDWGDETFLDIYPKEVIYPFKEYDFEGHKLLSFNNIKQFSILKYGQKSLKRKDENGEYYDPYPLKRRKCRHIKKFSLTRKK